MKFTKMHGLGNDYIYIDAIKNKDLKEIFTRYSLGALVRYLSDRHFGIGGDGVIFLDSSTVADFKMRIFNSDGTEAEMCGNGIRAFAKYIYDNSLAKGEILKIETLAGIKEIKREKYFTGINNEEIDEYVVNMGQPKVWGKTELEILDNKIETINISIGNPHAVIFVENVDNIQIDKIGPIIENYKYFPQKTNVEFVQILDKNLIKVRVWERGSGETLACGTGSCAAVIAGVTNNLIKRKVKVLLQGGELEIDWNEQDNNVYMKGIATKVFDGTIEI
ncbi:MAG: diaminopimelate epimerase [Clostridiales bacterium]|nr:diaminopimelate epimerase [Clostridiales bacterium]